MFKFDESTFQYVQGFYASNVKNRLRELESPDEHLMKRWIWELIQNAKDCSKEERSYIKKSDKITYTRTSQTVDIKIIFDKSKKILIFKHNGFPFTSRTLNSLMYRDSTKENDEDKTGRFGTGFMTSHTLSRTVPIHAPFLSHHDDVWELSYIEAIVYREGKSDKQLKKEFVKMEESKKQFPYDENNEEHEWTTFTYELKSEENLKSAELGIQSFRENIMEVLLFCNEINSIQLNDEDPIFSSAVSSSKNLTQSLKGQNIFSSIQLMEKNVTYLTERKFIIASAEQPSEEYSLKISKEQEEEYELKNLKFTIAFEIDSENKLVNIKENRICLFCTFPLIGSEKYQLPFLLNSPHFETFTERNGIILEGSKFKDDDLTNTGVNLLILDSTAELFKVVLQVLNQNDFTNFASFSNGLIFNTNTLDQMKPFLEQLRTIMEESKIIHNSEGNQLKLKEATILDFNGVKDPKAFHDLASQLYDNVASFEECIQWQNKTWEKISVLNVVTFVDHISHIGQNLPYNSPDNFSFKLTNKLFTDSLSNLTNSDFVFLNELYTFLINEENENQPKIKTRNDSIFYKFKIILNADNNFTFIENLKSNLECSEDFNKIMELCKKWKSKIINPRIHSFQEIIPKVTINDAIQEINSILDDDQNIDFLLNFVRFIINENDNRRKMYQVAKLFYEIQPEIILTDVDERLWSSVDSLLLKNINQIICNQKGKKFSKSLDELNFFYELYQKYNSNNNFLVPNFNLILTEKNKLGSISPEIDPILLDTLGPFINFNSYAHPSITSVTFKNVYHLDQLINKINSDDFFTKNGIMMDDRLFSVLSLMPPESNQRIFNFQTNVRELAQLFFCSDIKLIPTSIVNELFWKRANEIVLEAIEDCLSQHHNISNLIEILMKDEETIFSKLNMYYEILSSEESRQKKAMVPNYKGSFIPAQNICLSKGISEELFDLYNVVQTDSDIREKYAHPSVVCNFLDIIDFKQFISSICEGLSDDQLVNDSKILHAISNLNINKNNNTNQNENEILLQKLYTANIKNRLNEIKNPTENDKMRWPWELIQNAKDSLYSPSNTTKQKQVEIFIGIKSDEQTNEYTEISFSHNGPPFTDNSFIGLLYKISQEKDNPETTGRFGTGFVSTHVLSKIVDIIGNRIDKDGKLYGFSATMYREGTKEPDIIRDFKKMQDSRKTQLKPFSTTKFTYKINSEESRECVKLGLDHLNAHISISLINCPEIKFIVLNENGFQTKYYASKPLKKKINNITYYVYEIYKDSSVYQRFIVLFNKEQKVNIAIEIDEQGSIIPINNNLENIFVAFPLVGSNTHILPFFLNSPRFEPSTERNALILNGKEQIDGNLTNAGINRFLLMKSSELYVKLLNVLNENHCPNVYELSRGLLLSEQPYITFDMAWYQSNFLKNMKNVLASNVTVKTDLGETVLLKDAFFPSKEINTRIDKFIKLASKYCKGIVCEKDAIIWKDRAWDQLNIVEIEGLVFEVEADPNLFDCDDFTYLNDLLSFIWKFDRNILYEHSLIPDMNNELHSLSIEAETFDIRQSKTVQGQIIDIMESIGINWKGTHMNHQIDSISLPEDKIIDAESRIKEKITNDNSMCFELMKFVLENNEFRQNMFYFVTKLNLRDYSPIIVNDINPEIWDFADNYVLSQIIEKISAFSPEEVESLMEFFTIFLPLYQRFEKDESVFNSLKIIPNGKYHLCELRKLKNKKGDFHDRLNPVMIKYFEKDLDELIVHPEINQIIKAKEYESLSDILFAINKKIKEFEQEAKIEIAEAVISLIPQKEKQEAETKPSAQQQIFTLYHDLINHDLEVVPVHGILELWWKESNEIIIDHICRKIAESENLTKFKETFEINDDDQCFEILNLLYGLPYRIIEEHKIIPNRNGVFKLKKELKEDPGIEDDLFECISVLKPDAISKYELADHRVKINSLDRVNIFDFYKDLSEMFSEAFKKQDPDGEVIDMLKRIIHIDDPSFFDQIASKEMSEDQKARMRILQNSHVQFLYNRLRELKSASLKDFKRWPFELIQNANDSLFSRSLNEDDDDDDDDETRKVKITFDFSDEKVIFSHDGLPFTNDSLFALLYQCSEGKRKDAKSTGKFGTGFLSTHIVSRIIKFSGDVLTKDGISGFDVTMFRDGITDESLREGVIKMEDSLQKNLERKDLTTFEYILQKDDKNSKKACEEGLRSLKNNAGPVLIYNPTIESIAIKTPKETITYSANHEEGNIQTISITTIDAKQQRLTNTSNKYILFSSNLNYNESSNVDIDCLLQIDNNNEIIYKYNPDVLFISYPLFDQDQFHSPILINSKSFEPENERNNIIIQDIQKVQDEGKGKDKNEGRDKDEDKDKDEEIEESSESLINKFILTNIVDIFKQILTFVLDMNCTKLFNLANGLRFSSKSNFLGECFYGKMREVLLSFPIFETVNGLKKSDEVILPSISSYEMFNDYSKDDKKLGEKKKQHYHDFYYLVSQLIIDEKLIVDFECCKEWLSKSWNSFPSQFTIPSFIEFISKHENISDLEINVDDESESNEEFFITRNSKAKSNENDNDNENKNDNDNENKNDNDNENKNDNDNENKNDNDNENDNENKNDNDNENDNSNSNKLCCLSVSNDPKSNFIKNVIVFIEQLRDCDQILKENKLLINGKGKFVSSKDIHCFDLPDFIIDMFDLVKYDYKEKTLHTDIQHLYKNSSVTFEKFDLKEAVSIIKEKINETNAIHFMKYIIKGKERRTSMFEYTKFFLDESIESIEITNEGNESVIKDIEDMLFQADVCVIPNLIMSAQKLDIRQNLEFYIDFFKFLRNILSARNFGSLSICPNQKYELCQPSLLVGDGIHDENVKDILENILGMDLRKSLILAEFDRFFMNGKVTLDSISRRIIAAPAFTQLLQIQKEDRFSFYSIIFKYSNENEDVKQIMSALNFFLGFEIVEFSDEENKWSNDLINEVIKIASNEISSFISQHSTIYELQSNIESENKESNEFINLIFDNLSYIYKFTTEGKIFPNQIKQLVELSEISWLHDQQIDDNLMDQIVEFLIQFSHSDEIRQHILIESINVCESLKNKIEIYDLKYLTEQILEIISENPEKESIEFKQLMIKFLKFVNTSNELKINFSSLIKDEIDGKMDDFLRYLDDSESEIEIGYRGEALVYELLINSEKFSIVNWMAKSDEPTQFSINLSNGNTYYIKESGESYDIYAQDFDGNEYYFEVKSTKNDEKDKKFIFQISRSQFELANNMNEANNHFVLVLVRNVLDEPQFLFLTKQNEIFTL